MLLQENLAALSRKDLQVIDPRDEAVTDEDWQDLIDSSGMIGLPLDDS